MDLTTLPFFRHVKWQPDARELRRFAIAMLIGFSLLGLLAAWRAKGINTGALVLWGVGLFLSTAAFVPRLGRIAYLAVYLPTSLIGYVVSHVILTLMFFLVITPLAIVLRLMGKDRLRQKPPRQTGWIAVDSESNEDRYYRQF
jgi:hypothetical protein